MSALRLIIFLVTWSHVTQSQTTWSFGFCPWGIVASFRRFNPILVPPWEKPAKMWSETLIAERVISLH